MANEGEATKVDRMEVEDGVEDKGYQEERGKSAQERKVEEELGIELISAEELECLDKEVKMGKWHTLTDNRCSELKLCPYEPEGGKSNLAHLFGWFSKWGNGKN